MASQFLRTDSRDPEQLVWYSEGMESWWELGDWNGYSGSTLEVWRLTCRVVR